jgi:uncharacterized protein (TIGR02246 family)
MRYCFCLAGLIACLLFLVSPVLRSQSQPQEQNKPATEKKQEKAASSSPADHSADEEAIRANIAAFVKAYNDHDPKAIADLFTPNGQIVDEQGKASEGRAQIERAFKEMFSDSPKKQIDVNVESLRFIGPNVALEKGTTKESASGETPEYDRYTVLHVKREGKWFMALAEDADGDAPTAHEQLQPIAWLVGDWIDDDGSSVVKSTCRWSEGGNFLLQDFDLQLNGQNAMKVSQRIGWDPIAKQIHSWVFDSEGGYGESVWTQDGDTWLIKANGVSSDGKLGSATNTLIPAGKDAYIWRSRDRIVGDDVSDPIEVKVVRKPPQPKE